MTSCNHMLAGTFIAVTVPHIIIAVPLTLISHFVLDALPHFGNTDYQLNAHQTFKKYLVVEVVGLAGIALLIALGLYGWNLATLCALIAVLPDIEWPIEYLFFVRKGKKPPTTFTSKWHKKIQSYE